MLALARARLPTAGIRQLSVTAAAADKVGFIGLGNMGGPMAANAAGAGHELVVFDVNEASVNEAKGHGATAAGSPAEVAAACDTLVTMLPSNPHVRAVYLGDDGILSTARKGSLFIDCSTIDPTVSREVAGKAMGKGCDFVDAPVSGGVGGAQAGTLTFMVGGKQAAYERAKAVLESMGNNVFHCGDVGTGEVAKLCNNLILAVSMSGVAEAMNLGERLGADPKALADIINVSTGRCWSSDTYNPSPGVIESAPSSRGYTGGFGAALMRKDVGLALDAGKTTNSPLPMGSAAFAQYETLCTHGMGHLDFSSIFAFLRGGLDKATPPKGK